MTEHNLFLEIAFINVVILIQRLLGGRNQSVWYLDTPHTYQGLALKSQCLLQKKIVKVYSTGGGKKNDRNKVLNKVRQSCNRHLRNEFRYPINRTYPLTNPVMISLSLCALNDFKRYARESLLEQ